MAGTAKSNYLTVTDREHNKVLHKQFFNQGQMNDYMKLENFSCDNIQNVLKLVSEL